MEFFKKHADATVVLSAILSAFLWMNSSINEIKTDMNELKTDMAVIKTVLIMKNIMPTELAKETK